MVSNSMDMNLQAFLAEVARLRREFGDTEAYLAYRRELPQDWPV